MSLYHTMASHDLILQRRLACTCQHVQQGPVHIMSTNVQGAAHLDFTFAIVTALGGLAGYIKKRSMPSLIGGFAVAAAYTAAGTLIDVGLIRQLSRGIQCM